jgi:hypothetical protein
VSPLTLRVETPVQPAGISVGGEARDAERPGLHPHAERGDESEERQEGAVLILLRLLRLKFGKIPDAIRQRIEQADPETLLVWSERILTATDIDEVVR